ncbi:MAG: hypothetical protein QOF28_2933, partial [Actinomycetota bacterium]|nr:hypothetical protein [Actinomycetota bacterium]
MDSLGNGSTGRNPRGRGSTGVQTLDRAVALLEA